MKKIIIRAIKLYQKTLSPDFGWFRHRYPFGYCKYQPTCSEYCREAVEKHGAARGLSLGFLRVLRCNPWSKGGADPVK